MFVANFQLPIVGPLFDDVEFIELGREEAEKIVLDYNKEGQAALPPPEKRYREHGGYDYRGTSSIPPDLYIICLMHS